MKIGGINLILLLGLINMGLIIFQLLTGFRKIQVSFSLHRKTGVALLVTSLLHAALAFIANQ
jgi:hypothetical protein